MFGFTDVTDTWKPRLQVEAGDVIRSIKVILNYPEVNTVCQFIVIANMSTAKPEISPGKMQVKEKERGK